MIAEGAAGCAVAAALSGRAGGGKVVAVVSGGNIDLAACSPRSLESDDIVIDPANSNLRIFDLKRFNRTDTPACRRCPNP